MSQYALAALILITCEARRGEWVSLHCLIARLEAPGQRIEATAAQLVAQHKLLHATHAGHPYWGVGTEGLLPPPHPNPSNQSTTETP